LIFVTLSEIFEPTSFKLLTKLVEGLKEVGSKISDKVTKIKLTETITNIRKIKSVKKIKEQHLSAMMMTYELLKELKDSIKK